jgi:hypothetical protein
VDVVERDAGLADLLLDLLAEGVRLELAAHRHHLQVPHGRAGVAQGAEGRLHAEVHDVAVEVPAERRHRRADDPQVVAAGHRSPSYANP